MSAATPRTACGDCMQIHEGCMAVAVCGSIGGSRLEVRRPGVRPPRATKVAQASTGLGWWVGSPAKRFPEMKWWTRSTACEHIAFLLLQYPKSLGARASADTSFASVPPRRSVSATDTFPSATCSSSSRQWCKYVLASCMKTPMPEHQVSRLRQHASSQRRASMTSTVPATTSEGGARSLPV